MAKKKDRYRELRVERWARQVVAQDISLPVDRYEDGSQNGMVDAVIRTPFGAVPLEVVQDVNKPELRMSVALKQHGHRIEAPGLTPGWFVMLRHASNVRDVRRLLPDMLLRLDEILDDRPEWARTNSPALWGDEVPRPLRRIGVEYMAPLFDEPGPGSIWLSSEGWDGDYERDRLNSWVLEVLAREADVPKKLQAFAGGRGDVFIWATMASDIGVTGLLTDPDIAAIPRELPARVPKLPAGVDRVWVASTLAGRRAIVSDGGRWRWLDWVAGVELEAEEGP